VDVFLTKESVDVVVDVVDAVEVIVCVLETIVDLLIVGDTVGVLVFREDLDRVVVTFELIVITEEREPEDDIVEVFDCPDDLDDVDEVVADLDCKDDNECVDDIFPDRVFLFDFEFVGLDILLDVFFRENVMVGDEVNVFVDLIVYVVFELNVDVFVLRVLAVDVLDIIIVILFLEEVVIDLVDIIDLEEVDETVDVLELLNEPVGLDVLLIVNVGNDEADIDVDDDDVFDPRIVRVPVPLLEAVLDKGPDLVDEGEDELVFDCLIEDVDVIERAIVRVVVGLPVVVLVDVSVVDDLGELDDVLDIAPDRVDVLVDVDVFVDKNIGDAVNLEEAIVLTVINEDTVGFLEAIEDLVGTIPASSKFLEEFKYELELANPIDNKSRTQRITFL
jgi:hypothetical protein